MKFKKIYIEIINYCNLNCKFCLKTKKQNRMMTLNEFNKIINDIKKYTDYIYLHLQGEPLLHPSLKEILEICYQNNINVNITTNATLLSSNIDILLESKALRQVNISLQALQSLPNKEKYYDDIISLINKNKNIYIQLRFWGNLKNNDIIKELNYFENKLNTKINLEETNKILPRTFISLDEEFTWPSINGVE